MFGFVKYHVRVHIPVAYRVCLPQLRRFGGSHHPPQTPSVQGSATFLRRLHHQPRPYHLLLRIRQFLLFTNIAPAN
jgi:hypothetical protein